MATRITALTRHLTTNATKAVAAAAATKEFTRSSLREFTGEGGKPIYLALKGVVFDVSKGRDFYGPGGGYAVLGGRDASRALGKMLLTKDAVENPSLDDLDEKERGTLDSWFKKMSDKYPVVGKLV